MSKETRALSPFENLLNLMVKSDPLALFFSFSRQGLIRDAFLLLSARTDPRGFFLLSARIDPRDFFFLSTRTDPRVFLLTLG
jgi:hypothetical protein